MRRYETVSGLVFGLLATGQLARLLFRWPVQVAAVDVPLWISGLAVVVSGTLAIWAFRTASAARPL